MFEFLPLCSRFALLTWLSLCLGLPPESARADVYAFISEDGITHYSDSPTDPRFQLIHRQGPEPESEKLLGDVPGLSDKAFAQDIQAAAQRSGVEAALLHAVIAVESNYNARAVSRKGALGLMQLMPSTAHTMGVKDPMNAAQNILGGAKYLRVLLDQFGNNKSLALAAYNAGPAAVLNYGGRIPPFAETRSYVPTVLQRYAKNVERASSNNAE